MNRLHPILVAAALALGAQALPLAAAEAEVPYAPYLECAAAHGNYAFLLRKSGYTDEADLKKVESRVAVYARIAESLAGRPLRDELVATTARMQAKDEAVMHSEGAEGYLRHAAEAEQACAQRVEQDKPALLKAMEAYGAAQAHP